MNKKNDSNPSVYINLQVRVLLKKTAKETYYHHWLSQPYGKYQPVSTMETTHLEFAVSNIEINIIK